MSQHSTCILAYHNPSGYVAWTLHTSTIEWSLLLWSFPVFHYSRAWSERSSREYAWCNWWVNLFLIKSLPVVLFTSTLLKFMHSHVLSEMTSSLGHRVGKRGLRVAKMNCKSLSLYWHVDAAAEWTGGRTSGWIIYWNILFTTKGFSLVYTLLGWHTNSLILPRKISELAVSCICRMWGSTLEKLELTISSILLKALLMLIFGRGTVIDSLAIL